LLWRPILLPILEKIAVRVVEIGKNVLFACGDTSDSFRYAQSEKGSGNTAIRYRRNVIGSPDQ
jgi:hypothetical protein